VGRGSSPSSWAPPLGEGVVTGFPVAPPFPLVDGLGVAAPRVVGDAAVYGLTVAVAPGLGDAAVGRGEAVAASETLAAGEAVAPGLLCVWADTATIGASNMANIAPNRHNVFIGDKELHRRYGHKWWSY
jgi:hypothetical protein